MKHILKRGLLLLAFIIGLAFNLAAQSTQMTIHFNDGSERSYYLSENDRVYFEDNETLVVELAIYGKDVRSDRFNLADIRKITCQETVDTNENLLPDLSIFPNPVHDALMLPNLKGTMQAQLYTLDGKLIKSFEITEGQIVDISDLPIGMYLLNVDSKTLKLMKL